jgi:hypothetical protein
VGSGSPLKVREYCAKGIPFIDTSKAKDFPKDFQYRMLVDDCDAPINIEELINFRNKVYNEKDFGIKMRDFASKNLDWSVKMKELKFFLETL